MRIIVEEGHRGKRLDAFLHELFPEHSRSLLQIWIKSGRVLVNGVTAKPSLLLRGAEPVDIESAERPPLRAEPENIPLQMLYEDQWMLAINKPAGMVVHAGAGVHRGTAVNALLHRFQRLSTLGGAERPGIVHRLDRFTSGVLLVAKTDPAHQALAQLFASRRMSKTYLALVHGVIAHELGRIEKPIARDPVHRTRMTTRLSSGRAASTEWKVVERINGFTYLEVRIGTGRTHQIRVHLSSVGHSVVGDRLYGAPAHIDRMPDLGRYFLHAHRIAFTHPFRNEELSITAQLDRELVIWLDRLRIIRSGLP